MDEKRKTGFGALGWDDLARTSIVIGALASLLAIADLWKADTIVLPFEWRVIVISVLFCWLGFNFARLNMHWQKEIRDNVGDPSQVEGNFLELFLYQFSALGILSFAAFGNTVGQLAWPWNIDLNQSWQVVIFCIALVSSFIPLMFAFFRYDKFLRDKQYLDRIEGDHISDGSIWISALIVSLLACLAWAAGKQQIKLDGWYGPAVMLVVVSLFLFFVFLPSIVRANERRALLGNATAAGVVLSAGKLASFVDTWLALRLAPLTGATQTGRVPPHLMLLAIFLPLTVMGYSLSNGWGLLPISVAFILAVSLGRRWAWVESDRETAMRIQKTKGRGIKIGFGNDLRDEALLGYAFLFVLVPLALRQIQMIASPFVFETGADATSATLTEWASFFGTELAKAVPIVDWADIYGVKNSARIQATSESARHLVFFSRLLVDAIIIAALLQAWTIMQRNKSQRKLFDSGQLDMLDPFAERALFFRGVDNKGELTAKLKKVFEDRVEATQRLHGKEIPYNQNRLNELVHEDDEKLQCVATYLVQKYGLLAGSSRERLGQLRERWETADKKWKCESWVRDQRLVLEALMDEAQDRTNTWQITLVEESCRNLAVLLAKVSDRQEFVNAKAAAFQLLGERATLSSVAVLAGRLFPTQAGEVPRFVRKALKSENESWHFKREPLQEVRAQVVMALGRIYHYDKNRAASRLAKSLLEWVAENEAQKPTKAAMSALKRNPSAPCNGKCCPYQTPLLTPVQT